MIKQIKILFLFTFFISSLNLGFCKDDEFIKNNETFLNPVWDFVNIEIKKDSSIFYKNLIIILLAILYSFLYLLTIRQIVIEYHLASSLSFLWFAITNFWLAISNWFNIWSLWYFTAFIMWTITVISNEIIKRKIIKWELSPKIPKKHNF